MIQDVSVKELMELGFKPTSKISVEEFKKMRSAYWQEILKCYKPELAELLAKYRFVGACNNLNQGLREWKSNSMFKELCWEEAFRFLDAIQQNGRFNAKALKENKEKVRK
jgi:hypothetical protein